MTHPHRLRAQAALWALGDALDLLAQRAAQEDRVIAAEHAAAAEPLRSPIWGTRQALGGHSDPTADAVGTIAAPKTNRWDDLQSEVWGQLASVAEHLPPGQLRVGVEPVTRIRAAVPAMSERAAEATAQLADRIDARIRRLLHTPDDRLRLPRVPCPACDTVALVLRTSAPEPERVVECAACPGAWPATQMRENA